jgi:hypothetical protein
MAHNANQTTTTHQGKTVQHPPQALIIYHRNRLDTDWYNASQAIKAIAHPYGMEARRLAAKVTHPVQGQDIRHLADLLNLLK